MKTTFSKDELIKEVKKRTKVGKLIVKIEMEYLRSLASGKIYREVFRGAK